MKLTLLGAALALNVLFAPAHAQSPTIQSPEYATPESVGIDPARLARLTDFIERAIDNKEIPGAVVLVARNGKIVLYEAYGKRDPTRPEPMPKDAIFRIFSMSKPVTAATALRLAERGEIQLSDQLSKYLPAFASMQVVDRSRAPHASSPRASRPAAGEILLFDLLRHTAGFADEGFYPGYAGEQFRQAGIGSRDMTLAEAIDKVAALPLYADPGTVFSYSETSFTVLGRVMEVVRNQPIADIMATEFFKPLGMVDSGFEVPPEKAGRIAENFPAEGAAAERTSFDPTKPRLYHSTAAGLVSTALDYWRFVQMLLDSGRGPSADAFLAPTTVSTMLSNAIADVGKGAMYPFDSFLEGFDYGLGIGVRKSDRASTMLSGRDMFLWIGADGTMFFGDRDRNLAALVLTQKPEFEVNNVNVIGTLVMQSVVD